MTAEDDLRARLPELLGAEDVERLIDDARAEATRRVRSLLVEAFTQGLLARVQGHLPGVEQEPARALEPTPQPERPPEPEPEAPTAPHGVPAGGELGWYLYCVVGGEPDDLPVGHAGVAAGHPVSSISHGGLTAIVSRVALSEFDEEPLRERLGDMRWLERTARTHEEVLEAVARATTPIPMRLCSIYRDEAGVHEMLEREGEALERALAHLAGTSEWGVKVFAGGDVGAEAAPTHGGPAGGDGAAYMQTRLTARRRRAEAQRALQDACAEIHAALGAVAVEAVASPPQRPDVSGRDLPMVLNGSYLVIEEGRAAFHEELDRLTEAYRPLGLELEVTGPWPPYNFVPGAIGAAW